MKNPNENVHKSRQTQIQIQIQISSETTKPFCVLMRKRVTFERKQTKIEALRRKCVSMCVRVRVCVHAAAMLCRKWQSHILHKLRITNRLLSGTFVYMYICMYIHMHVDVSGKR
ncbi:unnamed protein product [Ceratitis capitata]|uniref:(Mediterranean fruit fly) hypothetical protein n=1 Tax=Ceratitis capitata TaxID=7213 RepID=A0A811V673_CERCA|nr:unnamed protein product [Ceratitis capitata]